MPFIPIFLIVGGLIVSHYATMKERNESNKIDFLDIEGDVKSSEAITQKYTGPKKGTVQIGRFRIGIIPLIIVGLLLINKIR